MFYKFAGSVSITYTNKVIFTGDNAQGFWKDGILTLQSKNLIYTYDGLGWYLVSTDIEKAVPSACGFDAVPMLEIDNLQILDAEEFERIKYIAENE